MAKTSQLRFKKRFEKLLKNGKKGIESLEENTLKVSLTDLVIDVNNGLSQNIFNDEAKKMLKKNFKKMKQRAKNQRNLLRAMSLADSDSRSITKTESKRTRALSSSRKRDITFDDQWKCKKFTAKLTSKIALKSSKKLNKSMGPYPNYGSKSPSPSNNGKESNIHSLNIDMISLQKIKEDSKSQIEDSRDEISEIKYLKRVNQNVANFHLMENQIKTVKARIEYYNKDRLDQLFENEPEMMKKIEDKLLEKKDQLDFMDETQSKMKKALEGTKPISSKFKEARGAKAKIDTGLGFREKKGKEVKRGVVRGKKDETSMTRFNNLVDTLNSYKPSRRLFGVKSKPKDDSFERIVQKVKKTVINLPGNKPANNANVQNLVHISDKVVDDKEYKESKEGTILETKKMEEKIDKRMKEIDDQVENSFFLLEKAEIEEKIKNQSMSWVGSEDNLKYLRACMENLDYVRSIKRKKFRLYSKLIDLPFFRTFGKEEAMITFSKGRFRECVKGHKEVYTVGMNKITILLRGAILVGKKYQITEKDIGKPMKDQDIFPILRGGEYENIYFELIDGDYLSPTISKFYKKNEKGVAEIEFTENSHLLEIFIDNEDIKEFIEKNIESDFYKKIDYLCEHDAFKTLSLESLQIISRKMYQKVFPYGEPIMEVGGKPTGAYILKKGTAVVKKINIFTTNFST